MLVHALVSALLCLTEVVNCQVCQTIPTPGATQRPERCIFPFIHLGKRYTACTRDHDPDKKLWCSVQVNSIGVHVTGKGRWGHCSNICNTIRRTSTRRTTTQPPTMRSTTIRPSPVFITTTPLQVPALVDQPQSIVECVTVSGNTPNKKCIFPFTHRGVAYNECPRDEIYPEMSWCSTRIDFFGNHVQGHWGHCDCRSRAGCPKEDFNELVEASQDGTYLPTSGDINFRCGVARLQKDKSTFIIGGETTKLQEFPFAVLLVYRHPTIGKLFSCGGSLINRRYVLTAAHCVTKDGPTAVRIGDYDITKQCDCINEEGSRLCAPLPQTIDIEEYKVHQNYDSRRITNDIALLRLAKPVHLNPGVGVVCLPGVSASLGSNLAGKVATVMGWGRTNAAHQGQLLAIGASTPVIQKVNVPIIDQGTCRRHFPKIDDNVICAGQLDADSCNGDSGGPLAYKSGPNQPWYLLGIVSFGDSRCGNGKPAVYVKVEQYIQWIRNNLKE